MKAHRLADHYREQPPKAYGRWIEDALPYALGLLPTPGDEWQLELNTAAVQSHHQSPVAPRSELCTLLNEEGACQHAWKNRVWNWQRSSNRKPRKAYGHWRLFTATAFRPVSPRRPVPACPGVSAKPVACRVMPNSISDAPATISALPVLLFIRCMMMRLGT